MPIIAEYGLNRLAQTKEPQLKQLFTHHRAAGGGRALAAGWSAE